MISIFTTACLHADEACENGLGQMLMVTAPPPPYEKIGGVLFFGDNFKTVNGPNDVISMINKLQEGRNPPLFLAIDNEGGLVQRLNQKKGFTNIPKAIRQGETSLNSVYNFGSIGATELAAVGINWNFGTVVDLHNPKSPIIGQFGRAFSADPDTVAADAMQSAQAQIDAGIIPTLKHFPGHGNSSSDSHIDYAIVDKTKAEMETSDVAPYRTILAGLTTAPAIMTGHLSLPKILDDPNLPASLSKDVVTGWLRNEIGFKGLIVSDDLSMGAIRKHYSPDEAVKKAILAGNDVLIVGVMKKQQQIIKRICDGADDELRGRITESYARILQNKRIFGILDFKPIPAIQDTNGFAQHQRLVTQLLGTKAEDAGDVLDGRAKASP